MSELDVLDEVLIAHELRRLLWGRFGERAVPSMALVDGVYTVHVRGTAAAYLVTIAANPEPWFELETRAPRADELGAGALTMMPAAPGPLDPATWAADYVLAALGIERAALLVAALTAGWLSDDERAALRPLAAAVAYLAGLEAPA